MKRLKLILWLVPILGCLALAVFLIRQQPGMTHDPVSFEQGPGSVGDGRPASSTTAEIEPADEPENEASAQPQIAEFYINHTEYPEPILATNRMISAHASLRTFEVSNPNSTQNRQILGAMIQKALAEQTKEISGP